MIKKMMRNKARRKRCARIRSKIFGIAGRPRLTVFRSLSHIYAQIVDDDLGVTLVSASTIEKGFKFNGTKKEKSNEIGKILAVRAIEKDIKNVIFDRNGYLYHGNVKELAEGAKSKGLVF